MTKGFVIYFKQPLAVDSGRISQIDYKPLIDYYSSLFMATDPTEVPGDWITIALLNGKRIKFHKSLIRYVEIGE